MRSKNYPDFKFNVSCPTLLLITPSDRFSCQKSYWRDWLSLAAVSRPYFMVLTSVLLACLCHILLWKNIKFVLKLGNKTKSCFSFFQTLKFCNYIVSAENGWLLHGDSFSLFNSSKLSSCNRTGIPNLYFKILCIIISIISDLRKKSGHCPKVSLALPPPS